MLIAFKDQPERFSLSPLANGQVATSESNINNDEANAPTGRQARRPAPTSQNDVQSGYII